jgi:hypothetical protein
LRSLEVASDHDAVPLGPFNLQMEFKHGSDIAIARGQEMERIKGTVEKFEDQMVAPTVSIPLVPTLALFWEKCGIAKHEAMSILKEAITEAMQAGIQENQKIKAQIDDVETAIEAVRKDLIAHLPKMSRAGRVVTKDLSVTELMVAEVEEPVIG